jgi:hypothetical protein
MMTDFVPSLPRTSVTLDQLGSPQRTDNSSVRCHQVVGNDIQSGPIYCGEMAVVIAFNKDGSRRWVAWCVDHVPERFRETSEAAGGE